MSTRDRLLVTGAGGFIGLNVVEQALRRGIEVIALTREPLPACASATLALIDAPLIVAFADLRDVTAVRALFDRHCPRTVVHAAAMTPGPHAPASIASDVIDVNVGGTACVLKAAIATGVERLVLTSSSAVYGDAPFGTAPLTESTPPTPTSLYAFTKLASERLAAQACKHDALDVIRTRLTAIYGPWEHDTGVRDTLSPPLQLAQAALAADACGMEEPNAISRIAAAGARDWTHALDIANAVLTLLEAPAPRHDLYNLGIGRIWHPQRLCEALASKLPRWQWRRIDDGDQETLPTIAYNDALERPRRSPVSATRFTDEFGEIFRPLNQAIDDYADWVVANRDAVSPRPR